jgi:hypothetical protein
MVAAKMVRSTVIVLLLGCGVGMICAVMQVAS